MHFESLRDFNISMEIYCSYIIKYISNPSKIIEELI